MIFVRNQGNYSNQYDLLVEIKAALIMLVLLFDRYWKLLILRMLKLILYSIQTLSKLFVALDQWNRLWEVTWDSESIKPLLPSAAGLLRIEMSVSRLSPVSVLCHSYILVHSLYLAELQAIISNLNRPLYNFVTFEFYHFYFVTFKYHFLLL